MAAAEQFSHAYPIPGFKIYYLQGSPGQALRPDRIQANRREPLIFWESRQLPLPNQQQSLTRREQRWQDCLGLDSTWSHHFIKSFHSTLITEKKRKKEPASPQEDISNPPDSAIAPTTSNLPEQAISSTVMLALLAEAHRHAKFVSYFGKVNLRNHFSVLIKNKQPYTIIYRVQLTY
jgi:hypothetical protein